MTKKSIFAGTLAVAVLTVGCQSTNTHDRFSYSFSPKECDQPKLTVRFVNHPGLQFACNQTSQQDVQLTSYTGSNSNWMQCNHSNCVGTNCGESKCTLCNLPCWFGNLFRCKGESMADCGTSGKTNCGDCSKNCYSSVATTTSGDSVKLCNMGGLAFGGDPLPQHAILWGNGYNGQNVTTCPTSLTPGAYTFAYFDPDRGTAYQGWLAVNSGGDDVMSALTEWRNTVHTQEEWLAFEYKINGKYSSHNADDFKRFQGQLANLRRLENKINAAIHAEQKDREKNCWYRNQYFNNTQVVLMPGPGNGFAQPSTLPAFNPADLSAAQNGEPVTKVILAGDFQRAMEKLDRLYDLQGEMRRCRTALSEEINRLENRRSYFRLTSHLYNHDYNFVANEQRVQKARGLLAGIDRQINENRRHGHAVLAVVGLFAPEEANLAFEREEAEIRGERAVWAERLNQVEMQFSEASTWSEKRVALERQRQYFIGQIKECDAQLTQAEQAMETVAQLRANTGVIYRNGPASILAASFVTDSVPARLANAIEKESMMTVRLHSAEGLRPSTKHLTEGGVINDQMFMLTGDRSNFERPTIYDHDGWDAQQQNLIEWSETQRNYGQPRPQPTNGGHYPYGQP